MAADATMVELVKEVRWKTLKILEGVTDEQARWAPAGTVNSILWHAGHALVVVEHLGVMADEPDTKPTYPAEWFSKFSWESKPAEVKEWPAVAEVVEKLKDQRTRLLARLETLSQERLDKVVGPAPRNRTLRGMILHGLHDESGHQGEMYLLKKLYARRG
jgi:hypothetical protein